MSHTSKNGVMQEEGAFQMLKAAAFAPGTFWKGHFLELTIYRVNDFLFDIVAYKK